MAYQKKWTVRDEFMISDALVYELDRVPPNANHPVVDRLCTTLSAKRAAVVWKLRNHAQFHEGYKGAPTNASALSKAIALGYVRDRELMHQIAQAMRREI